MGVWDRVLYSASVSTAKKKGKGMKSYCIMIGHGNDEVAPDQFDLDLYESGDLTWLGLVTNYEAKLRMQEANRWMERVSSEAVNEDVLLFDSTKDPRRSLRVVLAKIMANIFGGQMNFQYNGEL